MDEIRDGYYVWRLPDEASERRPQDCPDDRATPEGQPQQ